MRACRIAVWSSAGGALCGASFCLLFRASAVGAFVMTAAAVVVFVTGPDARGHVKGWTTFVDSPRSSLVNILVATANCSLQADCALGFQFADYGDNFLLRSFDVFHLHFAEGFHVLAHHVGAALGHTAEKMLFYFVAGSLESHHGNLAVHPREHFLDCVLIERQ